MLGILFDMVLVGIIIAAMEGDFPEWLRLLGCVVAIGLSTFVVSAILPGLWSLLGIVAGALVGGVVISALCGMEVKRAAMVAGIYMAVKMAVVGAFLTIFSG